MNLPEPLLSYMSDARPLHETLRLSLIQLSAFALQQATSRHRFAVDFSSVEKAAQSYAGAKDGLRALRVSNGAWQASVDGQSCDFAGAPRAVHG